MFNEPYIEILSRIDLRLVQFRVKSYFDIRPWSEIKEVALTTHVIDKAGADMIALKLLEKFENAQQVRWNIFGVGQGHYLDRQLDC